MIVARILGVDDAAEHLAGLPDLVRDALAPRVADLASDIERNARANAPVRSGALRASIAAEVAVTEDAIGASVGSDLPYARILEYGFADVETVRAHLRRIREVFGRPLRGGERLAAVRVHARRATVEERSYLRSALDELSPQITAAAAEAVEEAAEQ